MPTLTDLPGTKNPLQATTAHSLNEALRLFSSGCRAITAAGSTGALSVWRDDKGAIRCELYRNRQVLSTDCATNRAALRTWLRIWWPAIGRDDVVADRA